MTEIKNGTLRIFVDTSDYIPFTEIYVYIDSNWYKISSKSTEGIQRELELIPYPVYPWKTFDYLQDIKKNFGLETDLTIHIDDIIEKVKEKKNENNKHN